MSVIIGITTLRVARNEGESKSKSESEGEGEGEGEVNSSS